MRFRPRVRTGSAARTNRSKERRSAQRETNLYERREFEVSAPAVRRYFRCSGLSGTKD
jgi:hypothetical protein